MRNHIIVAVELFDDGSMKNLLAFKYQIVDRTTIRKTLIDF